MKLNLTQTQYKFIWNELYPIGSAATDTGLRIDTWNKQAKPKYKLDYYEQSISDKDDGWYGTIEGDEKDITWFLLNI
jgi:hypothetical protein